MLSLGTQETRELGELFNAFTSEFSARPAAWTMPEPSLLRAANPEASATYSYSGSLEESRAQAGMTEERCLDVDVGIEHIDAARAGHLLRGRRATMHEVRVDLTCTVVTQRRSIGSTAPPNAGGCTHYVREVEEGGSATLSFFCEASSESDEHDITGFLLRELPRCVASGDAGAMSSGPLRNTKVQLHSALPMAVATVAEAVALARRLPSILSKRTDTLKVSLAPFSNVVPSPCVLAPGFIRQLTSTLKESTHVQLQLGHMHHRLSCLLNGNLPEVETQVAQFREIFERFHADFCKSVRENLPGMRRPATHSATQELLEARKEKFDRCVLEAKEFAQKKAHECEKLAETVGAVPGLLGRRNGAASSATSFPAVWLSFPVVKITQATKKLKSMLERLFRSDDDGDGGDDGADIDDDDEEECHSCKQLAILQKEDSASAATFAVCTRPLKVEAGPNRTRQARLGDVVVQIQPNDKLYCVKTWPRAPDFVCGASTETSITLKVAPEESSGVPGLDCSALIVRYRPVPNKELDGIHEEEIRQNAPVAEFEVKGHPASVELLDLKGGTDYEISLQVETPLGRSDPSSPRIFRTRASLTPAVSLIEFYRENRATLSLGSLPSSKIPIWATTGQKKPWDQEGNFLFLGFHTKQVLKHTNGEPAVLVVDVAPEFHPEIKAAEIGDEINTQVIIFSGPTGHGKTTQINAFISFLLRGALRDPLRVMVVDDRGSSQTESVTKWVTVYRLRPISPAMGGKTILIVDTPGFYDTGGIESDNRTTEAIGHLFGLLTHVNALVFVCKCQEVRKNVLEPVVTMVFHLFAKDVHDCLRTILTFADLSEPLTLGTLGALQWPVKPDDTWVKVNNCAFGLKATEAEIGDWWRISVNSQRRVHQMLQMPAVSTCQSVQVAKYRTQVEGMCDRLRLEITQAMEGLNGVLNHLNGIAESIGAPPTKLVPVARPVKRHFEAPKGYLLTFCTVCARVCHNRCVYPEGRCRDTCAVMYHQKCTRCPNHCGFDKHNNARCFDGISVETDNVVSAELLSQWNGRRASAEGSILKTIEEYQGLQANLHRQLTDLKRVSRCLEEQALKHRPGVLVSHLKTLIGLAKKEGRPTCQLDSFLQNLELQDIASSTPGSASSPTSPSVSAEAPTRALFMVKHELERQNRSQNAQTGVVSFYNALVAILPAELTLPPDVPRTITGSTYAENLKATVKLTHFLLSRTVAVASHDS